MLKPPIAADPLSSSRMQLASDHNNLQGPLPQNGKPLFALSLNRRKPTPFLFLDGWKPDSLMGEHPWTPALKVLDFDWIDAPNPESISSAAQDLLDWYALADNRFLARSLLILQNRGFLKDDAAITPSCRLAARCPMDPIWYRAIEVGVSLGCSMDIVDIALLRSSRADIFLRPDQYRRSQIWPEDPSHIRCRTTSHSQTRLTRTCKHAGCTCKKIPPNSTLAPGAKFIS